MDLVQRRLANIEAAIGNHGNSQSDKELRRTLSRLEARIENLAAHQDEDDDFEDAPRRRRTRRDEHADDLRGRLGKIEASLGTMPGDEGNKELRRTLARLEARIESLADSKEPEKAEEPRRDLDRKLDEITKLLVNRDHKTSDHKTDDSSDDDGTVASGAARSGMRPRDLARIESKLNMLLSRDNTAPAVPAYLDPSSGYAPSTNAGDVTAPGVSPARRSLADSIADINRRQQTLDGTARATNQASRPAYDPAMKTEAHAPLQHRPSPAQARQSASQNDSVRNDLRSIAAQLEELRRQNSGEANINASQVVSAAQQAQQAQQDKTNAAIEQLGHQIAEVNRTISGLAPKQSLATIETAIRDLTDRVVHSRQDGVKDNVLAPIETLIGDLKYSIDARNAA
ncbi:MAG: hypothetical protein KDJ29_09365, partial [Hyphomicrobiales bacterium]|nr:hypothetical protein [Hyphomicrobiales bacterium]